MARYDYHCTHCNNYFEVEYPMGEHPEVLCPVCGAQASHVFSANAIAFKGSGFYNTDQRGSSASTTASSAPAETSTPHEKSSSNTDKATSTAPASTAKASSTDD